MPYIIPAYPPRRRLRRKPRRKAQRRTTSPPEKRAMLIGIEYRSDPNNKLPGCHNDVFTIKNWLSKVHGVRHFKLLMDRRKFERPTKRNILKRFRQLLQSGSKKLYLSYSGHGASLRDSNNDERDGRDEILIPVDFGKN
jgi:hypothetical protein